MNEIATAPGTLALPVVLSEGASRALEQSSADNTRRSYAAAWSDFVRWCGDNERMALPATSETVADYLAALAEGYKLATVRHRLSVINQAHEAKGIDSPGKTRLVRSVVRGIANQKASGGERKRKVEPILTAHLQAITAKLDREGTTEAKRDKALLLIGFAGAFRRSELGSLSVEDVAFDNGRGVKITVRKSKTDQEGEGQSVGIAHGRNESTCPVVALRAWLDASGIVSGPVFQSFRKGGHLTGKGLSGEAIRRIVKDRVGTVLGADEAEGFSGHSMRRGFVSQGVLNGATERGMMKTTRHRSIETFRSYVKDFGVWHDNESGSLGL
ncbi:integrase [bacterium]|nr:integrase [bacterium]